MENIFFQVSVVLGITVLVAVIVRLLRQPLLVAYLIAGIVAGPLALNLLRGNAAVFQAFSEFGVVLLLFVVGLHLNLDYLRKVGRSVIIAGLAQLIFTALVGYALLFAFPLAASSRIYLAVAITFSSTIIIAKLLTDKHDTDRTYGRQTIGLMIVQDLIAIALLIGLSTFGTGSAIIPALIGLVIRGGAIVIGIILLARYVLPRILDRVARSGEFLFIFTIAWCFAIASIVHLAGFSIEIGAIIAGLSLGSSPYQPEIASRTRPLRDFFLVLFFVILGSQMQMNDLRAALPIGLALATFILIGNPLILYLVFRRMQFTRRNSFLAGVTAAQVSEFGFILLFTGQQLGHVGVIELSVFTIAALITFILSSYLITYNEQCYRLLLPLFAKFGKDRVQQREPVTDRYDAWVFGYHRIGWKVCEALAAKSISFAVVDDNPEAIAKLKLRGIPAYFGDASDVEFLSEIPLAHSKIIVSTLPDADDERTLIQHVRRQNDTTRIIVNAYHASDLDGLYAAGADFVMMPHLLGGLWIADVLTERPWTKQTFDTLRKTQHEEMKLRRTAQVH